MAEQWYEVKRVFSEEHACGCVCWQPQTRPSRQAGHCFPAQYPHILRPGISLLLWGVDTPCVAQMFLKSGCTSHCMYSLHASFLPGKQFLRGAPTCTPWEAGPRRSTYPGSGVDQGAVPQQAPHDLHLPRPGSHVQGRLAALPETKSVEVSGRPCLGRQRVQGAYL